jgi:hypothetical protein
MSPCAGTLGAVASRGEKGAFVDIPIAAPAVPAVQRTKLLYFSGLSLIALVVVVFGGFLATMQHPEHGDLTKMQVLDLLGVFVNVVATAWSFVWFTGGNTALGKLKEVNEEKGMSIFWFSFFTLFAVIGASFCAAVTIDPSDVPGHSLAVFLAVYFALMQSAYIWRTCAGSSHELSELGKEWALRFDLPASIAYLIVTLFLLVELHGRLTVDRVDGHVELLHGFLSGAVAFHLTVSAVTFMLANLRLIREPR